MILMATYVRSFIGLIFLSIYTLVLSLASIFFGGLKLHRAADVVVHVWGLGILWFFGVRVKAEGLEQLPKERGFLLLFNHQSFFDIFVLHAILKGRFRFGAKIELFKIPFFGSAMRMVGALPIARENRKDAMRVYQEASHRFAEGWSFILAPEGTRQTESAIGRFKKGPFIFAMGARAPFVPAVIRGTLPLMRKNSVHINIGAWRRTVRVRFLPPVETSQTSMDQLQDMIDRTHSVMVSAYADLATP